MKLQWDILIASSLGVLFLLMYAAVLMVGPSR